MSTLPATIRRPLEGRVAIVTGAGRGIGAAIADRLAADGALLVVNDIDADAAKETQTRLESAGHQCALAVGDVAQPETAPAIVEVATREFGRLDILVNNAGTGHRLKFRDWTPDLWNEIIGINLSGPFYLSQAAADDLSASGNGAIVNICSVAVIGFFGQIAYDASKGGLLTLTRSLAVELGREKIRVNSVCPGFIQTRAAAEGDLAGIAEKQTKGLPAQRMGEPAEIANAVAFLVSDEASYVTGQSLFVDGGWVRD